MKSCKWGCVKGYCLSLNANHDENKCKNNMEELSKEDQERIDEWALNYVLNHESTSTAIESVEQEAFKNGCIAEHPIAKKEGFNEALEEVKSILGKYPLGSGKNYKVSDIFEEIEKLKR